MFIQKKEGNLEGSLDHISVIHGPKMAAKAPELQSCSEK